MTTFSAAAQLKLLKKLYAFDNTSLDDNDVSIVSDVSVISSGALEHLRSVGLAPNTIVTLEHDDVVVRLQRAATELTQAQAVGLFLDGVSGKAIRFRQTLISFFFARSIPTHAFRPLQMGGTNLIDAGPSTCEVCGLPSSTTVDATAELVTYHLGHSGNEGTSGFVLELEETIRLLPTLKIDGAPKVLHEVLDVIASADVGEPPSGLQARLAKAKRIPKSEKYMRYGILQTLAECGVLPQTALPVLVDGFVPFLSRIEAAHKLKTSSRSDIVLPLAGWSGATPLDHDRARSVFGI